jgi:tetratricopeptide (TPR) repeat protein
VQIETAGAQLRELVNAGEYEAALSQAASLSGDEFAVRQLQAWTAAEIGADSDDLELLAKAAESWEALHAKRPNPQFLYNRASTAEASFRVVVRTEGHAKALEAQRENLDLARRCYAEVGDDEEADTIVRLQALTNLGNGFDMLGRDLDSIAAYEKAIAIDPDFGMAQGNKGVALVGVARLADGHTSAVLSQAVDALDKALADRARVVAFGSPNAYETFQDTRAKIDVKQGKAGGEGHTHSPHSEAWSDPYLEWCRRSRLFLHVSLDCLSEDTEILDPLFFSRVVVKTSEDSGTDRINILHDAFNSIKQDFISARYSAWLVSDPASPIRKQAAETSSRARFLDSLTYAKWGVRTGMTMQAFTTAANLLDKIACFTHLYLGTGRVRDVYFSSFWHPRSGKKAKQMEPAFAEELAKGTFNRGLLALCDLSSDLSRESRLAEIIDRRHTATHRFLVAHEFGKELGPTGDFLDRVTWSELVDGLVWQLQTARAALIYLARLVEIREGRMIRDATERGGVVPPLPVMRAETEHQDFD